MKYKIRLIAEIAGKNLRSAKRELSLLMQDFSGRDKKNKQIAINPGSQNLLKIFSANYNNFKKIKNYLDSVKFDKGRPFVECTPPEEIKRYQVYRVQTDNTLDFSGNKEDAFELLSCLFDSGFINNINSIEIDQKLESCNLFGEG
jgi:hypothetical protein